MFEQQYLRYQYKKKNVEFDLFFSTVIDRTRQKKDQQKFAVLKRLTNWKITVKGVGKIRNNDKKLKNYEFKKSFQKSDESDGAILKTSK